MKFIRHLLLAAALTAALSAEPVYLSAHGKTFHRTEHCMSLARAKHIYTADRTAAEQHGLHECSICYRAHKAGAKTAGAPAWATETQRAPEAKP